MPLSSIVVGFYEILVFVKQKACKKIGQYQIRRVKESFGPELNVEQFYKKLKKTKRSQNSTTDDTRDAFLLSRDS